MKKGLWLAVGLVLLATAASALEFGAQGFYWYPELSGDLRVDAGGVVGTRFDLEEDMDVDKEGFIGVKLFAGLGSHHLSVEAMRVTYKGTYTQNEEIIFGGIVIPITADGDFELDYAMVDAIYRWDLIDLENVLAGFSLGPILSGKLLQGTAELTATHPLASEHQKEEFNAIIPMVGAGAHVGILADLLEANLEVRGIGYNGNKVIDARAEIAYTPFPFLDVGVGYRVIQLDVDYDDVSLDLSQAGPWAGLTLGF